MTVAFALMPLIRSPWHAFAVYVVWGAGSGSFWPSQSALLAGAHAARAPLAGVRAAAADDEPRCRGRRAHCRVHRVGRASRRSFTVLFLVNCVTYVAYMLVLAARADAGASSGARRRQLARSRTRPDVPRLHRTERGVHDCGDLADDRAAAGVRQERDARERAGGRRHLRARRNRHRHLPAPGREARRGTATDARPRADGRPLGGLAPHRLGGGRRGRRQPSPPPCSPARCSCSRSASACTARSTRRSASTSRRRSSSAATSRCRASPGRLAGSSGPPPAASPSQHAPLLLWPAAAAVNLACAAWALALERRLPERAR